MTPESKPEADAFTVLVSEVIDELLSGQGELAPLDVLLALEVIDAEQVESWRRGGLPYLERGITCGLARVARILRIVQQQAQARGLTPKSARYVKRGKGPRRPLRFSKRGDVESERAYATHFVKGAE